MLFHSIVYGPIKSRRLGNSLGMNILPTDQKICSFDCIYCECGWNTPITTLNYPTPPEVKKALSDTLTSMNTDSLDVITFCGNGEPTLHPQFLTIIEDTIQLRNRFCPHVKISVLTNSTNLDKPNVAKAIMLCDNRILKLDSAINSTMQLINQPNNRSLTKEKIIHNIKPFRNHFILQTCLLKGKCNNQVVDNTTEEEVKALYDVIDELSPSQIMLYCIDRTTPCPDLLKIDAQIMEAIASPLREKGYNVMVCC